MNISEKQRRILYALGALGLGIFLVTWLIYTPPGLLGKADAVGYAICHRIAERSFMLGERQIAMCARCTGQYLGVFFTLLYLYWKYGKSAELPPQWVMGILGAMFLTWGFDGANSLAALIPGFPNLYEPNNTLRLITGLGFGMAIGSVVFIGFNQVAWQSPPPGAVLPDARGLLGLVAVNGLAGLLVLSENPLLLYPLTLLSAAGALLILSLIFTIFWLTITRTDNQAQRYRDLLTAWVVGLGLAFVQVGILDAVRFWLTGTWEGFHIFL